MVLTFEQVTELKKQLHEQVKHLPVEQKAEAEQQIEEMSAEALESMLQQQRGRKGRSEDQKEQKSIFRMLVDGEIPAKKIDETKDAIAIVSKRAVSKGHVLIIPKKIAALSKDLPSGVFTLGKKIAKKITSKLGAVNVEIQSSNAFGECVLNVAPVYETPIDFKKQYEVSEEELEEIYMKLRIVVKPKVIRIKKKTAPEKILQLRRRVP